MSYATNERSVLSKEKRQYLKQRLGDSYEIHEQLGMTGAKTSAYFVTDIHGKEYALKIPNVKDEVWEKEQLSTYHQISSFFVQYHGNIELPKFIIAGDGFVLEPFYGYDFKEQSFRSCSLEEQRKLMTDMALFLHFLHHLDVRDVIPLQFFRDPTLQEVLHFFTHILTDVELAVLKQQIEQFESRDQSDERCVWTHGDLRAQNILYHSNQLAIIDFDFLGMRSIYHDFVPFAAASFQLSYDFWFGMINLYNDISDLKIDKEKVWLLHRLGIYHEYARCAIIKKTTIEEFSKYLPQMRDKIDQLDSCYQKS